MRNVHWLFRIISSSVYLFAIDYHHDMDVIVIDKMAAHPVLADGTFGKNVIEKELTDDDKRSAIELLNKDGII